MAQTPTRKNAVTSLSAAVAYAPTALDAAVAYSPTFGGTGIAIEEKEADCKTKFHAINVGAALMAADQTALSATITPLNADIAKLTTNLTAIDNGLAPLETNVTTAGNNFTTLAADRIAYQVTLISSDATGEITDGIPAGYEVTRFYFRNTTASATGPGDPVTIKVGTSAGGEQIMAAAAITSTGASVITEATVVAHSATAAARTIYVSSAAWDSAVYTVDYICEKVLY
jgi:hypothetical protein